MVATLTSGRESYAGIRSEAAKAAEEAATLRRRLMHIAVEDAAAFEEVMNALNLPRGTEAEIARRNSARADALKGAASVQYELLLLAAQAAELAEGLVERGLRSAVGDAASAVFLSVPPAEAPTGPSAPICGVSTMIPKPTAWPRPRSNGSRWSKPSSARFSSSLGKRV
jgi:formiminotetrahydrofolate cyclodeaminase